MLQIVIPEYPLAADNGPMAPMGGYAGSDIASLTDTWKDLYDIDVNIQISWPRWRNWTTALCLGVLHDPVYRQNVHRKEIFCN